VATRLSLLDVLPRHERVDIGSDKPIDVFGISSEDIAKILERYPDAFQQMYDAQRQPMNMHPGLLGAMVAASQRNDNDESLLGDEKAEKLSRSLGASDQVKLYQALGRCTFPDGIGPFLESLASMSLSMVEAVQVIVQVASKVPDTALPQKPKNSELQDIPASGK
jgi:hypothetical protein